VASLLCCSAIHLHELRVCLSKLNRLYTETLPKLTMRAASRESDTFLKQATCGECIGYHGPFCSQASWGGAAVGFPSVICSDDARKDKNLGHQLAQIVYRDRLDTPGKLSLHVPIIPEHGEWVLKHGTAPVRDAPPRLGDSLHSASIRATMKQDKYHARARITNKFPQCDPYPFSVQPRT
jgi:hypothetical protein